MADKKLKECRLNEEGVVILGIHRDNGGFVGAPKGDTDIYPDDILVIYGREQTLNAIGERKAGPGGESDHAAAVHEQEKQEAVQEKQEADYRTRREERSDEPSA